MNRRWTWLVCALVVCCAWAAVGWAADDGSNPLTRASNLAGIKGHLQGVKKILGGILYVVSTLSLALGSVAMMCVAAALSPERVARTEAALRRGRWKAVILGVVSAVVLLAVAMLLGKAAEAGLGILGIAVVLVLGFLIWLAVVGLAGMAAIVGRSLLGAAAAQCRWRVVGVGGLVLAGSLLIPLFGWAYFLYALCRGLGAATLTLFAGRATAEPEMETKESEPEGNIPAE